MSTNWIYFPRSTKPPAMAVAIVGVFDAVHSSIESANRDLKSNAVLAHLAPGLAALGFQVETGKSASELISVPVLFGSKGKVEKAFEADAYHEAEGFVVEVEAGRGVMNNQFLKDLFQACMMVGVRNMAVAVRNNYKGSKDYEQVVKFFETLYASNRLRLPLEGVLIIGY